MHKAYNHARFMLCHHPTSKGLLQLGDATEPVTTRVAEQLLGGFLFPTLVNAIVARTNTVHRAMVPAAESATAASNSQASLATLGVPARMLSAITLHGGAPLYQLQPRA